jgi:hypothetical protein
MTLFASLVKGKNVNFIYMLFLRTSTLQQSGKAA